jgi:ornithine cyclodeaminase/alanine dehydrogenase-like protein (mu-crystallin family)
MKILGAEAVAALDWADAIAALRRAILLGAGASTPPRTAVDVRAGQLLLMAAHAGDYAGVKVATIAPDNPTRGIPRVQGEYLLFAASTLATLAVVDGTALTARRTAAVSALAVDLLASPDAAHLVVFGTGPQALAHVSAITAIRPVRELTVIGRRPDRAAEFIARCAIPATVGPPESVASADVVVCATTARAPLFDSSRLRPSATVVAVGSHEPSAREVDTGLVARATVVVESRASAGREAGDVLLAVADGVPAEQAVDGDLAELVAGRVPLPSDRPRLFKSVGEAWEDLAVAAAVYECATM